MNMFDEARSLAGMIKMRRLSQSEVAKMLGVSQSYVANKIRLLGLDEELQKRIAESNLSERHARLLLSLDESARSEALDKICEGRLNVKESEALVSFMNTHNLPNKIDNSSRLRAIEIFLKGTKGSVSSLSSIGISATQKVSYHGRKMIVTICIDEG